MLKKPYPYDPERLETEVSAVIKIKDIEELYRLKDAVSVKWWETGLILLLFCSGFGFILTVSRIIPAENPFIYWFSLFWFAAIVISIIFSLEFLIHKFRALRRLNEIQTRILASMQKELKQLRDRAFSAEKPPSRNAQSE